MHERMEDWQEIAEECEAFLHGRLTEYHLGRGEDTPLWAWFNKFAHATEDELVRIADGKEPAYGHGRNLASWNQAASVLAGELLRRAEMMGLRVSALQRARLVPFELACARTASGCPLTPQLLVSVTRAVLSDHPSAHGMLL